MTRPGQGEEMPNVTERPGASAPRKTTRDEVREQVAVSMADPPWVRSARGSFRGVDQTSDRSRSEAEVKSKLSKVKVAGGRALGK